MANPSSGIQRPIFQVEWNLNYVWNTSTLAWDPMTQPGGGGGGGTVDQGTGGLSPWLVTGPLTDTQLRATPVPVSGTVAVTQPVAVTDNGGSLTVDGTFFQATQPISAATLPLPAGAATAALQTQPGVDIGDVTINNAGAGSAVNIQDGGNSITIDAASLPLPTGAATSALQTQPGVDIGDVTVNNAAGASAVNIQDGGNIITVDGTVGVNNFPATQPVSIAATVITTETRPGTGTHSNVSGTGSSVSLAASNANRRGLTVYNDSGVVAYVKAGTGASSTSFLIKMVDQSYFEFPQPVYTGAVEGLWASGSVRVVELT